MFPFILIWGKWEVYLYHNDLENRENWMIVVGQCNVSEDREYIFYRKNLFNKSTS